MGLFNFIKRQMLEVIEMVDESTNTLAKKFDLKDREEIMNSSTLVVRPSQVAIFVHKGQIADIFGPGSYKLATENIPFLTKLLSLPTGFNSTIKAEVYFVSTKQISGQKWGTQNPIMIRDEEFGSVRIRAFGAYSFKVNDAKKFMEEAFGTNSSFTTEGISEHLRPSILQGFVDYLGESKISALDLAANYNEFSENVKEQSQKHFDAFGLEICSVLIENISLPEELEKALDERTKLGMFESKMGTYTQLAAADAMKLAAANEGGNMASMGVGLGAGVGIGQMFSQAFANVQNAPQNAAPVAQKHAPIKDCSNCGASIKADAKFCPECGAAQAAEKHCTNCGAKIKIDAKFCAECGAKQD